MKNLVFIIALSLFLTGCPKKDEAPAPTTPTEGVKTDETKAPEGVTDEAKPDEAKKDEAKKKYPAYDGEYMSVKQVRVEAKEALKSSTCDGCVTVGKWMFGHIACGASEVAIDAACTLAEVVFFELDEIVIPLCTAFEVSMGVLCAEYGEQWIEDNTAEAAKWMCEQAKLCP